MLAFLLSLALIAGPWFTFIVLRFNRVGELGWIPGLAASLGEPQITEGLAGLLSGQVVRPPAATYNLPEWLGLLYRSFWFEYGWMRLFAPAWVYLLFSIFLGLAIIGLIRSPKLSLIHYPLSISILLGLHVGLFVLVVAARYILSATIDTGQGRHLYPALPVIAIMISLGVVALGTEWWGRSAGVMRMMLRTAYCVLLTAFLGPALIVLQPGLFVRPNYRTIPVTAAPPEAVPIQYRHNIPVGDEFSLAGFAVENQINAGQALPVTLYWQVARQVNRDYLVLLCLHDGQDRPVGCAVSHFADGHYPARAWEANELIADTIKIPIPTCYRILDQAYRLNLELWPLRADSLQPDVEPQPVIQHTFAAPDIVIRATDSLLSNQPQTIDLWQARQRLTGPVTMTMNESLSQISYRVDPPELAPAGFIGQADQRWQPLEQFSTDLYLPCDEGPSPFARLDHFITHAGLPAARYQPAPEALAGITIAIANRHRTYAGIDTTTSFTHTLSPLSITLPNTAPVSLAAQTNPPTSPQLTISNLQSPISFYQLPLTTLPVTIRWQARRWMADPLVISLKLLDKDFNVGGERVASLGDRYPNVLWAPTEIVEETYPVHVDPAALPGLYQLELSLIRQDRSLPNGFAYLPVTNGEAMLGQNLYPAIIRLLDPAHDSPPSQPISATLGDSIELTGYDLNQLLITNYQSPLEFALYWQSTAQISTDFTVFTQLIGPDGQVYAQWDNPPQAGRYPTSVWAANDVVVDRYALSLRDGAPAGDYQLLVGLYDPASGERLPVLIDGQRQPNDAIKVATIKFAP